MDANARTDEPIKFVIRRFGGEDGEIDDSIVAVQCQEYPIRINLVPEGVMDDSVDSDESVPKIVVEDILCRNGFGLRWNSAGNDGDLPYFGDLLFGGGRDDDTRKAYEIAGVRRAKIPDSRSRVEPFPA